MCEVSEKLIFCTCLEKKEGDQLIGQHKWTLERYIGARESSLKGKIMRASTDLDDEIHVDKVIEEMNSRNCFDFEYLPQERDCFHIDNGLDRPDYKYFSLIFKNGEWVKGQNEVRIG